MSAIIVNDVAMEGKVGERLLNVARRNAAHIGFLCDNAGTCQGCRCQVLAGEEQLSPPSEAERAWIPAARLERGERLACQAIIRGRGEVRVISRAEELRRMVMGVIAPRPGESRLAPVGPLVVTLAQMGADQLAHFPVNVLSSIWRVGPLRFAFPILDRERMLGDAARVVQQLRAGAPQPRRLRAQAIPLLQVGPEGEGEVAVESR